jgi:hypothetical protein
MYGGWRHSISGYEGADVENVPAVASPGNKILLFLAKKKSVAFFSRPFFHIIIIIIKILVWSLFHGQSPTFAEQS